MACICIHTCIIHFHTHYTVDESIDHKRWAPLILHIVRIYKNENIGEGEHWGRTPPKSCQVVVPSWFFPPPPWVMDRCSFTCMYYNVAYACCNLPKRPQFSFNLAGFLVTLSLVTLWFCFEFWLPNKLYSLFHCLSFGAVSQDFPSLLLETKLS